MIEPIVYRIGQAAELLQVSRATVYRGIAEKRIPAVRFGRAIRVPRWWVDEQVARRVA